MADYSEQDLQALVDKATSAAFNVYQAYQANKTAILRLIPDLMSNYKGWWIGENETTAILNSYKAWLSSPVNRANVPAWFLPYHFFVNDAFRTYGARFKKLYEISQKIRAAYPMYEVGGAWSGYISIYGQFKDNNPAEPEKPGLQKSLEEAWAKLSPVLKWGAIGLAAVIALSGMTKKRDG